MSLATTCVNGVCSCILPLDRNDFRPLALRHRSLAFVSALLVAVKVIALLAIAVTPNTAELSTITAARVVQLTNAERQKAGQGALTVNSQLSAAAQRKGEDMLAHDYFAHISPSGVTPWFWMQQQNYTYQVAGENLAIDFVEVEDVVAAWLNTPSHRDNMLHGAYTETGVAAVTGEFQGGTSTIVVHMFGLPAGASAAAGLPPSPTPAPATAGTQQKATPTPSPSPTPTLAPAPDVTPPRTPRIAVAGGGKPVVSEKLLVAVEADPTSTIALLVNDTEVAMASAAASPMSLDVSGLAEGEFTVTAVARDAAGNTSSRSNSLLVQKDATGPSFNRSLATFILGPATDSPTVAASIATADATGITIRHGDAENNFTATDSIVLPVMTGETTFTLRDEVGNSGEPITLALLPNYAIEMDTSASTPPARLNQVSRIFIGLVFAVLVALLMTAFFVRISIQRPTMLAHTSAVAVLAAILFLL